MRAIYGVSEAQLKRYYQRALRGPGNPAENLLQLLERRLDNVVYRLGFARSRPMARQLVSQGHVRVNERRVTIPSYLVREGEKIALTETAATFPTVSEELEQQHPTPSWLQRVDGDGRVLSLPSLNDINAPVDARKVIAFYSR